MSILGGTGNDSLVGNQGSDRLLGEDGDDVLVTGSTAGGLTADSLDGGAGTDRVASTGDVAFTLSDTTLSGVGTSVLVSIERAALTGGAGTNLVKLEGWSGEATLDGAGAGDTYAITLTGATTSRTTIQDSGADGQDSLTLPDCTATTVTPTLVTRAGESIALSGVEGLPCGVTAGAPAPPPAPSPTGTGPGAVVPVVARVGRPLSPRRTGSRRSCASPARRPRRHVPRDGRAEGDGRRAIRPRQGHAPADAPAGQRRVRRPQAGTHAQRPGGADEAGPRRADADRLLRVVVTVRARDDRGVHRVTTGTRTLKARRAR
ncbi:MAG: hypothetical protein R3C15_18860 [Thermoleophilia bacterium]